MSLEAAAFDWWLCGICGAINDPDHVYCRLCYHADKSFEPCGFEFGTKDIDAFRRAIRAAVRAYFRGEIENQFNFVDLVFSALQRFYQHAWYEGAASCGILPEELSDEERQALNRLVNTDIQYVFGLAQEVQRRAQAGESEAVAFPPLYDRIELWVNRYNAVRHQAGTMACANDKRMWLVGATRQHCGSCAGFHGLVYRFVVWAQNGAIPQSRRLLCGGWRCRCDLIHTNDRARPGRFPASLLM